MNEIPPFRFTPPKDPAPECDERLYWHKRFNLASWLFLILMFWAIFTSATPWSALIALTTSIGLRFADGVCQARHIMWHMKNNEEGHL